MEVTEIIIIAVVLAAVVLGIVLFVVRRGKVSTEAVLDKDGLAIRSKAEEEGSDLTTISGVTIKDTKGANVDANSPGAHIKDVRIENAEDVDVKAGKGD